MNFKISEKRMWFAEEIRQLCIARGWYTSGTTEKYAKMLDFVGKRKPTKENIFKVACDIYEHSTEESLAYMAVSNIMSEIANEHVYFAYEVKKEEK